MNLMEFDRSFVRQRNEDLRREVRRQRFEKRLREAVNVGKSGPCKGKGAFFSFGRIAVVLAVVAVMATAIASSPAFSTHEHYLLTPANG